MINVAVMGYGTVGSGVAKVIMDNNAIVSRNVGDKVNLKYVLDIRDFPGDPVEKILTKDCNDIVNDPEVDIVVETMGGTGVAWTGDPDYVMISVIIFTLWADLGYNIILFSAGIDGIPGEVYEAAAIDGAGPVRKFFSVTLPLLGRTTTFVVLMTLISYFQMFAQFSVLLYKDGPQNSGLVLTSYIYKTAFVNKDMGYAAAISVILFLMILIVSLVQRKLGKVEWEY